MAFTNGNDINLLQASDTATVGAGLGNDVYLLGPDVLGAGQRVTISDTQGANTLRLTGGLTIQSSRATGQSLELTLSNGAIVSLLDADTFSFELGGNGLSPSPVAQSYGEFLTQSLGYADVPGVAPVANTMTATVQQDGTTSGGGGEPPPPPGTSGALTPQNDTLTGTADANLFTGVLAADPTVNTLNPADTINGGGGVDFLRINASVDFGGFAAGKGTTSVEVLRLINEVDGPRVFNATGMSGLQRVEIEANDNSVSLTQLAASSLPLSVRISDVDEAQTFSAAFANDVAIGINDAVTFELEGVGRLATPTLAEEVVNLVVDEVELLTLNALSGTSVVDASVGMARQVNILGAGNLRVVDVDATLQAVSASQAQGDLSLDLLSALGLATVSLGAGDDVVRVASEQLVPDARLTGGGGDDELILLRPSLTQDPTFGGFESVRLVDTKESFNFSPTNISGFEALTIERGISENATVTVNAGLAPLDSVTLAGRSVALPPTEGAVRYLNEGDLQLNVTPDSIGGSQVRARFDAPLLDDLSASVANGVTYTSGPTSAAPLVSVASVSRFALNVAANAEFDGAINAPRLSELVISGLGDIAIRSNSMLGQKDQTVTVDATRYASGVIGDGMGGTEDAVFSLAAKNTQDLVFQGGLLGRYDITLTGSRNTLDITTGVNDDAVVLNGLGAGPHAYSIALGDISEGDSLELSVANNVTEVDFRPLQVLGVDAFTISGDPLGALTDVLLPQGLIPDDTFTFKNMVSVIVASSIEDEVFDFDDLGGNAGSFVFGADAPANGFDEILGFTPADPAETLDFTAFNDDLVFATKGQLGGERGLFTKNPLVLGGVDVGDQIVRLVDIEGGEDITTAEGLTTALRAGGEYANLNIKDGSSIFLTGPDADFNGEAEAPTSVFFVTVDGEGLETAAAIGVIRMVGVGQFTIDDFVGASEPPGLLG